MSIHQTISQLANQCVLCGICIPHCPTYHLFRTENESPRGRISLFKALAEDQLVPAKALLTSLDHCLGCLACEKSCPSQVDYAQLSRLGRELINRQYPAYKRPLKQKLIEKALLTPSFHPLLKLAVKTFAPFLPLLSKQSNYPSIRYFAHEISSATSHTTTLQAFYPAPDKPGSHAKPGKVILFKGCSADLFEHQVLIDTLSLLNACGFDIVIPEHQQCCGAMSVRPGDAHAMQTFARKNIDSFAALLQDSQAIISINNSCSAHLQNYKQFSDHAGADEFSAKSIDAIAFLSHAIQSAQLRFSPLQDPSIGVHIACSLKNALKEEALLLSLLDNIPDIQLNKLNDRFCCGAAGSYMLQYPEVANNLLNDKIEEVVHQQYNTIVSSNLGCSLHFKQGLENTERMSARKIEIIHPISLLARQLEH